MKELLSRELDCKRAFGTWSNKVCTAETADAKALRECEVGWNWLPTGQTYKAATGECFKADWHQEEMCAMPTIYKFGVVGDYHFVADTVFDDPYFVADAVNGNWCLDYTSDFSMACDTKCSDWGRTCVPEEFAYICEDNAALVLKTNVDGTT